MDLSNYRPPRRDIPVGSEGTLSVRGLSLADVALLMDAHQASLLAAYAGFEALRAQPDMDDTKLTVSIVMSLLTEAPRVAADIIALSVDRPDAAAAAATLPFPVQVQALIAVANLTFEAGGGLGELLAALKSAGRGVGIEIGAKALPKANLSSRPTS